MLNLDPQLTGTTVVERNYLWIRYGSDGSGSEAAHGRPFPLGDPMAKIRLQNPGTGLEIERALTPSERRKMLDAVDLLLQVDGRSNDRNRYRNAERPTRKTYRPYRNRAIIYALIETGYGGQLSPAWSSRPSTGSSEPSVSSKKVGSTHTYSISREGIEAIQDYVERERPADAQH